MKKEHIVYKVEDGSIAMEMGVESGDKLISVNGTDIEDVLDYHYLINDDNLLVVIEKKDGEIWELEIEKDYDEDLGIEFENGLMDEYKSCQNKCVFCFIDQMPPGMRETLYFKDDDSRLSFLQGNYVTLTNMKEKDLNRIITYKMAPINVSVHTTNPKLRDKMLHNRFAGESLSKLKRLSDAGIEMNGQVVCCKGLNDGKELEKTISDLTEFIPQMQSLSIVPVGLTKYRENLYPLETFQKEDAKEVLNIIHKWQKICFEKYQTHFVHAGDEWYLLAEEELPEEDNYDGYIQLENGVGMLRLLINEFTEALEAKSKKKDYSKINISIATGKLAAPFLEQLTQMFCKKYKGSKIHVLEIKNNFFGEKITVSGLLTGQDIVAQLKGKELGDRLLLPGNLLRSGEEVLLDDMSLADLKNDLQVPIDIVKSSGWDLLECITLDS